MATDDPVASVLLSSQDASDEDLARRLQDLDFQDNSHSSTDSSWQVVKSRKNQKESVAEDLHLDNSENAQDEKTQDENAQDDLNAFGFDSELGHIVGNWFDFDDSRISSIHPSTIETQFSGAESAYILVYRSRNLGIHHAEAPSVWVDPILLGRLFLLFFLIFNYLGGGGF